MAPAPRGPLHRLSPISTSMSRPAMLKLVRARAAAEEPLEEVAEPLLAARPGVRTCRLQPGGGVKSVPAFQFAPKLVVACALLGSDRTRCLVQLLEASVGRLVGRLTSGGASGEPL